MNKDFVFELDGGEKVVKKKMAVLPLSDDEESDVDEEMGEDGDLLSTGGEGVVKKTALSDEEESDVDDEEEDDVDEEDDDEEGDEEEDDVDEEMEEQVKGRKNSRSKLPKVRMEVVHGTEEDTQASSFFSSSAGASFSSRSFGELNLSRPLIRACEALGYKQPTPIQVISMFVLYSSVISLAQ